MKLKDPDAWAKFVDVNSKVEDPGGRAYSMCVVNFAEAWANEMERLMATGATLADVAENASREVDERPGFGITGFQYGAAVLTLSQVWEHGEELRLWHNRKTQIRDEGDRANEEPGVVLNPAVLSFAKR